MQQLLVIAIPKCQRKLNLFRNIMNYCNLRECRLQVSHVSVIYHHGTHSCIILRMCLLKNNAFSFPHYVIKVTE